MEDIHFKFNDQKITIIELQHLWLSNPNLTLVLKDRTVIPSNKTKDIKTINGNNYTTTMNPYYLEELTKYKQWLHETMVDQLNQPGNTFENLLIPINHNLIQKIATLPENKFIDVSDLNNLKIISSSKNKFKGTKIKLISSNYESFFAAVCSIENGVSRYAEDIRLAKLYFNIKSEKLDVCIMTTKNPEIPEKVLKNYPKYIRPKTFMQMLNTVPNTKVIDVSNIDDKGFNGILIMKNKITNQFIAEKIPLISDNLEHFESAIYILRGEEKFKSDLIKARLFFTDDQPNYLDILGTLENGNVIDVSNITSDGENIVVIPITSIPSNYYKGKEINIVSSNYEGFEQGIMLIDNGYFDYKLDLQKAKVFFNKIYYDVSKVNLNNINVNIIDERDIGDKYISTVINMVSDNFDSYLTALTLTGKNMEDFKEDIELAKEYFGVDNKLPNKYMIILNSDNKKYLDVSNIKDNGTGIVIINEKDIKDQYAAINVKIVSNNYKSFIKALILIPDKDYNIYADDIFYAIEYFKDASYSNKLIFL